MKTRTMGLVLLLSSLAVPAFAFDSAPAEPGALYCYARAMVGFDSVINSRLGVPAELTVGLATKNPAAAVSHENYAQYMGGGGRGAGGGGGGPRGGAGGGGDH